VGLDVFRDASLVFAHPSSCSLFFGQPDEGAPLPGAADLSVMLANDFAAQLEKVLVLLLVPPFWAVIVRRGN